MSLVKQIPLSLVQQHDTRSSNWFFSGIFTSGIIVPICYIFTVFVLIPRYMRNREPYVFKKFLICYNVFQIFANLFLLFFGLPVIIDINPFMLINSCSSDYSLTEHQKDTAALYTYYTLTLKIIDLTETVVFALRKKSSQISTLHVYHHVSVLWLTLISVKYYETLHIAFPLFLNQFVHVLMYSYYLSTNLSAPIRKFSHKLKRYITIIQMIQFVLVLCHSSQYFLVPGCDVPKAAVVFIVINIAIYLFLFYDFYKRSYEEQRKVKQK